MRTRLGRKTDEVAVQMKNDDSLRHPAKMSKSTLPHDLQSSSRAAS